MAPMSAERWSRVKALFDSALSRQPAERASFLEEACGGDTELRGEVESLLAAHERPGSFLDTAEVAVEPAPAELAGQSIGPYNVIARIGAGGMGEVYRARDPRLGRDVAIKLLLPQLAQDSEIVRRFRLEPRAAAALNHPNICTVHDVGEWEARPYFTMEYLEGQTLQQRLAAGPLEWEELISTACAVVGAVEAAHAKGIVHRDIKPANIFVTAAGLVKVMDFGLAKRVARVSAEQSGRGTARPADVSISALPLTMPGAAVGTVAYMSPEQVRGEDLDTRSDLFSLGALLYEIATGQQAFRGESSAVILDAILSGTPAPASAINPVLPRELEEIIGKALEKDRALRYQTAADLKADLLRLKRDSDPRLFAFAYGKPVRWGAARYVAACVAIAAVAAAAYAVYSARRGRAPGSSAMVVRPERMSVARNFSTTALLLNGSVLAAGGCSTPGMDSCTGTLASAEVLNPASGEWSPSGAMAVPRLLHTATTLASGNVLVAGGCEGGNLSICAAPHASAEEYDAGPGVWRAAGEMPAGRVSHSATLLPDGRVLVAGGTGACGRATCEILASAAVYDPKLRAWSTAAPMSQGRLGHTAILLLNGQVLVAGGCPFLGSGRECRGTATAELYDPVSGAWSATGFLRTGRTFATATLLPTGQVLVAGGVDGTGLQSATAELYDPTTRAWTATGSMISPRYGHTATLLRDGEVLIAGGGIAAGELFDPGRRLWTAAGSASTVRSSHTATMLGNGVVLVLGGHDGSNVPLAAAEIFAPDSRHWMW
jgi:serine/threonine protein kinase